MTHNGVYLVFIDCMKSYSWKWSWSTWGAEELPRHCPTKINIPFLAKRRRQTDMVEAFEYLNVKYKTLHLPSLNTPIEKAWQVTQNKLKILKQLWLSWTFYHTIAFLHKVFQPSKTSWAENAKVLSDIFWHFTCFSFTFLIALVMGI